MHSCPNCGKEVAEDAAHCGHCGHQLEVGQKKTMLGLGAVDAEALKANIAKAKSAKAKEEQGEAKTSGADEGDANEEVPLAKTELMDVVDLPTPGQSSADANADDASSEDGAAKGSDFVTAPTEAMDTVDASDLGSDEWAGDQDLAATEETPQVAASMAAADERGDDDDRDDEAGGRWEIGQEDSEPGLAFDSAGESAVADPMADPMADGDSEAPGLEAPAGDGAPVMSGSAMDDAPVQASPNEVAAASDLGASAAQVGDGGSFDPAGGDDGSNKKMFLIAGAVLFVLFGCCISGTAIAYFTGSFGG